MQKLPDATIGASVCPQGCINTSAPVGTVFDIVFLVFDGSQPAGFASVTRTLTVAPPCSTGWTWCDGACSPVDCETRSELLGEQPDTVPPTITLLHGNSLRFAYGAEQAISLVPCALNATRVNCGAVAEDDSEGDVTMYMRAVQARASCATPSKHPPQLGAAALMEGGCRACALEAVTAGVCLPGTYAYHFSVADVYGNEARATLSVVVVETARVTASLRLAANLAPADAAAQATSLLDSSSNASAAFRAGVAALANERLVAPHFALSAADVDVVFADARALAPSDPTDGEDVVLDFEFVVGVGVNTSVAGVPAWEGAGGEGGARRVLLQSDAGAAASLLSVLTEDLKQLLQSSATPRVDAWNRTVAPLSAYLRKEAASLGDTDVVMFPTEVTGLAEAPESRAATPALDWDAANRAELASEMETLRRSKEEALEAAEATRAALQLPASAGGDGIAGARAWLDSHLALWADKLRAAGGEVRDLSQAASEVGETMAPSDAQAADSGIEPDSLLSSFPSLAAAEALLERRRSSVAGWVAEVAAADQAGEGQTGGGRRALAAETGDGAQCDEVVLEVRSGSVGCGGGGARLLGDARVETGKGVFVETPTMLREL